jgi:NADPH:quinone reductase-like Zn-dependent oxidoreductase
MKAAQISEYGGRDVIQVNENVSRPMPEDGQVLIEVVAAAVNPFDVKVREGQVKDFITLKFPATLGGDVAGIVAEIGPGVTGFRIGDEVFGSANAAGGQGSFAEFTPAKAETLALKPKSVDFITAAALPMSTVSAYQALVEHMNLQPNQKILIHGGAGGIGSQAIQIAKNIGAYVATTASTKETDFVKELGADEAIDYKSQDFSQLLNNYDAVFDTVGGETNAKSYTILKPGGTLVSMVQPPDEALVKQSDITYVLQQSRTITERLTKIAEMVDDGKLKVNIDKVFSLDQAAQAVEHLKSNHPRGKVVIKIKT